MLRGNYYINIEQTTSHSPSSFIRKKTLELEPLYSPSNKKPFFPTLPPSSNRNSSNFKIINSLKKRNAFPSLPKIECYQYKEERKNDSFETYSHSNIISPSISFEKRLNTNEPILFHKKIIMEGYKNFNERMKAIKNENIKKENNQILNQCIEEKEDEKSDIEKVRFVKAYKKKEIDNEIINIINHETSRFKIQKEKKNTSRNRYNTKPLYLQKLEPVMFISKNHPMLEFNQVGTIQKMFQDGPFMGKLLHDSFEHMNDKRYQIALNC